jgi:outer membrane protein OmpA-like peptidoglycan-associated protein
LNLITSFNFFSLLRKLYLFLFIISFSSHGQEVVWASKVLEKSSETVDEKFSLKHRAIQALGPPSVLPQTVSSACSWRPTGISFGEDYIKVGFDQGVKVRQIIIGETVGPGAVGRIFGYTKSGAEILLYQNAGMNLRKRPGIWNEMIPETAEEIVAIKLLIVHSLNKGPKEYDCIGISASSEPFVAKINLAKNLPQNLEKINLGPTINSKYSEVAPLVSPDGKYLYFTRLDHPKNYGSRNPKKSSGGEDDSNLDVWVSKLSSSGAWSVAENMDKPIHDGLKNAAATIAMDGKSIYALNVKNAKGENEAGLTKVTLKNGAWTNRRQVQIQGFEALSYYNLNDRKPKLETEFSMSSDEKYLVMGLVRRVSESYGDKDLYVSFKIGDNTYSRPINLGAVLNTAGNEGSPFLAADNKTLYFNSNGHPGYGDMDIFMTTRLDDTWTNWSTPVNLGPLINSPQFDGYISIPASGEYAYFSSAKNAIGMDDLFKIKLFPSIRPEAVVMVDFKFVDNVTKKALTPKIQLLNIDKPNDKTLKVEVVYDEESQTYKSVLPVGYKYALTTEHEGYTNLTEEFDFKNVSDYREVTKTFEVESKKKPVQPKPEVKVADPVVVSKKPESNKEPESVDDITLEAGKKLILKEVYFDQSKADLREESFVELEKIKKIMLENPTMEILLEGHTDNQGDANLNFKLAEGRIKNVKDYITKDGRIAASRIGVKSWGQYRPLLKNSTEEARTKNRRVEFTITKM